MNRMLVQNHLAKISINQYRDLFSFPVKNYYEKLGFDFEHESFEKAGNEFINEYKKHRYEAQLFPKTVSSPITEFGPTLHPSPILTPFSMHAPGPIETSLPILA